MASFGQRLALMAVLGALAGYTDTICYKRNQSMAVMMTGNLLVGGRAFADMRDSFDKIVTVLYYVTLIFSYCFGSFTYRLAETKRAGAGATMLAPIIVILFVLCEVLDFVIEEQARTRWLMCLLAPCFGAANNMSLAGCISVNATTATGHLVTIGNLFGKRALAGLSGEERNKVRISTVILLSFLGGIIVADVVSDPFERRHWLFLPVGPLLAMVFVLHDRIARSGMVRAVDVEKAEAPLASTVSPGLVQDSSSTIGEQLIVQFSNECLHESH